MKFRIHWIESHDPQNWADDDIEDYDKRAKNGLKNILDSLPNAKCTHEDNEGWVEIECWDEFEAKNIEKAKKKALEYDVSETGVFCVTDTKNKKLFDEQDC